MIVLVRFSPPEIGAADRSNDQQERPVDGLRPFMPPRFEARSRDLGKFRKDRTAVHRRTAPGLRAVGMPRMVITLPHHCTVLALKGARRRGHAERIRRHQESDDQKLSVAEDASKSHSAGFPSGAELCGSRNIPQYQ
ncbi:hypothetical protein [Rhizobium leguminosarum]|uniref:hypothetical protein n=1 Tax=Rhizobium leguminosarum TaxID=384 RepID=UPI001C967C51|nr:hypothetical protein [Rhizobium leguminosarum]MBY5520309.1 hypothetical protein [Rhizobium leguminosarum]